VVAGIITGVVAGITEMAVIIEAITTTVILKRGIKYKIGSEAFHLSLEQLFKAFSYKPTIQ
jgi:hypothetical protein